MKFTKHPVWAMAFRPFYSLAALYGALSVLLWGSATRERMSCPVSIGTRMR